MLGWADDDGAGAVPAAFASPLPAPPSVPGPHTLSVERIELLISRGRFGAGAQDSLQTLDDLMPVLELSGDSVAVLLALYGRVVLQIAGQGPTADLVAACDLLERVAGERRDPVWSATAGALRARIRLDAGQVASAMADLARVDLEQLGRELHSVAGCALLEVTASAAAGLRLHTQADDARRRLDALIGGRPVPDQALHWTGWAVELVGQAMEPLARGNSGPDQALLDQALTLAARVRTLDAALVPAALLRTADGVRALAEAHRGRPAEALRILGRDAFELPAGLAPGDTQVVRLAALHAHTVAGSNARARALDDLPGPTSRALPSVLLEVCRARDRVRLEAQAGGDLVPVLERLAGLLSELAWQGMDLAAQAARQALDHQSLRTESRTDPLTGVGNRRALDEELRGMLRTLPLPMALILVDVDDFKAVNDRFTHVVGDEVLRRVAASLARGLRSGDRLVRYGGDEFVVLLPRTGDQDARMVAGRMAEAIVQLPWSELADGLQVQVTTGCAALWSLTSRRPEPDAERLFMRADEALLEAKRRRVTLEPEPRWETPARPFPVVDLRAPGPRTPHLDPPHPDLPHLDPPHLDLPHLDLQHLDPAAHWTQPNPTDVDLRTGPHPIWQLEPAVDLRSHEPTTSRADAVPPVWASSPLRLSALEPPTPVNGSTGTEWILNGSAPHPPAPHPSSAHPSSAHPSSAHPAAVHGSGSNGSSRSVPALEHPPLPGGPEATVVVDETPAAPSRRSGRRAAIIDLSTDRTASPFG